MDLDILRRRLAEVNPALVQSVKVYFVNKRKVGLTAYIPNVHEEVRQELLEMYSETLLKPVFDLEQVAYNELGSIEDTIEVASLDQVNMEQTLNAILYQENQTQDLEQNMNIDDINYYMIQIAVGEEYIFIFKRFNKQKKLRKGFRGKFNGNDFNKLETDIIIGIDPDIDLLVFQNELLIVNRLSIQYISDLKDYYVQKANEALESIESFDKIINFENFRNDCISDGHLIKRVTRIANSPGIIDDFFDKFDRLQDVVDAASLAIQIENEKINYSGTREERLDILKCIADSLYQTLLQRNIGEDKLK